LANAVFAMECAPDVMRRWRVRQFAISPAR